VTILGGFYHSGKVFVSSSGFLANFTNLKPKLTVMKKLQLFVIILFLTFQAYSQKYVKVWSDEFNTPGLPDSTKWDYEVGKLRNAELQYYTSKRKENARIQDTTLIIEARKEAYMGAAYTSASLVSKFKGDWQYGKFEIRAKVPAGKGTWPAIWMVPTNEEYGGWPKSGEIDIMEYVGMNANNLYYTAHFEGTDGSGHQSSGTQITSSQPYSKFITYSLIWTPTKLEWYADGVKYWTYTASPTDPRVWPFNKEFYMILNLAYGGSWGGQQGVDDTKLPVKFYIDYVRVYQLQDTPSPFSLKVNPVIGGTVEVSPIQPDYTEGTMVTLTAKPAEGYQFARWLYLSSANPVQIEMNKNWTITPVFEKKNEVIINGDFSQGINNWGGLYLNNTTTMAATSSVIDSVYVVNITKPGTANWHICGQQLNVPLIQNMTYNITFDAWAENPNTMDVFLSKNHDDYGNYYSTVKSVTKFRQKFTYTVKMAQATDLNCRFGFGFGQFLGKVYIDNVSIEKMAVTGSQTLSNLSSENVRVFPNPNSGVLEISFAAMPEYPVSIELYNLQGQLVSRLLDNKSLTSGQTIRFNLNEQKIGKGIYLLRISSKDKKFTQKLVVS
jgi:beta-glucanase (GH16 family)